MRAILDPLDSQYPSKTALMKSMRDASRRFGMDPISAGIKLHLNSIGYRQDDIHQSGFQYLSEVLNDNFTEGLPGLMAPYSVTIESLSVEEFSNWYTNCDIVLALKHTLMMFGVA